MGPGAYNNMPVVRPIPAWKGLLIVAGIFIMISGMVSGFVWIGYTVGYREGDTEGERRTKQEAIDAGVAEYGPNPKATKFQWKPNHESSRR